MSATAPVAYDLPGAAAAAGVSIDYLRRQIGAGNLRARKVGRKYVVGREDLQTWFESLPEAS